jgi:hypothetical protein
MTRTFDPTKNQYVTVTGVLELASTTFAGVAWRVQPRNDADIVVNPTLGTEPVLPTEISFAISPNPSRVGRVVFALPKRDHVRIAVYDIAGRQLALLADREFEASPDHSLEWNGRDQSGKAVGPGVYFYKMTVGTETWQRRGILLN